MKFLDVLKKFDKAVVTENKKLQDIYATLLKESDEEAAKIEEIETLEKKCCDEAEKSEKKDDKVEEAEKKDDKNEDLNEGESDEKENTLEESDNKLTFVYIELTDDVKNTDESIKDFSKKYPSLTFLKTKHQSINGYPQIAIIGTKQDIKKFIKTDYIGTNDESDILNQFGVKSWDQFFADHMIPESENTEDKVEETSKEDEFFKDSEDEVADDKTDAKESEEDKEDADKTEESEEDLEEASINMQTAEEFFKNEDTTGESEEDNEDADKTEESEDKEDADADKDMTKEGEFNVDDFFKEADDEEKEDVEEKEVVCPKCGNKECTCESDKDDDEIEESEEEQLKEALRLKKFVKENRHLFG